MNVDQMVSFVFGFLLMNLKEQQVHSDEAKLLIAEIEEIQARYTDDMRAEVLKIGARGADVMAKICRARN
jgi:hypothetical protein